MRIDWSQYPYPTEEDRQFMRLMRAARALAAVFVIGGIAVVGIASGPFDTDMEFARADAAVDVTTQRGLMELEAGVPG
jgi:hypothetical protein